MILIVWNIHCVCISKSIIYCFRIYFCQFKFIYIPILHISQWIFQFTPYLKIVSLKFRTYIVFYIIIDFNDYIIKWSFVYCRGCTRGTVTFFKYDFQQKQLITTRTMHFGKLKKTSIPTLISCLHVSLDKWNRHLAVASYSNRLCVLRVFRVEDLPELCHNCRPSYDNVDLSAHFVESLTDRYRSNSYIEKWMIKVSILIIHFHLFILLTKKNDWIKIVNIFFDILITYWRNCRVCLVLKCA